MHANKILTQKFSQKRNLMYLRVSYKKKIKIKIIFYILKVIEERRRIRSWIRIQIH
jgi:hypothetical protein